MVKGIKFTEKRFETKDDYNVLYPLTMNTIIICNNAKIITITTAIEPGIPSVAIAFSITLNVTISLFYFQQ